MPRNLNRGSIGRKRRGAPCRCHQHIVAGEFAENEMRKNFMPSERVAIMETIERKGIGARTDLGLQSDRGEVAKVAELGGFSSLDTARRAPAKKRETSWGVMRTQALLPLRWLLGDQRGGRRGAECGDR